MARWIKTAFPGVRFREHPSRKHGLQKDRYFTIRRKVDGKDIEEALGWASEGWTPSKAYERLAELRANHQAGQGPQSLKEKRVLAKAQREAEALEVERAALENMTFDAFVKGHYLPHSQHNRTPLAHRTEERFYRLYIAPVVAELAVNEVAPFHIEKIKRSMAAKGKSPRTIERALQSIRQIVHRAIDEGIYKGPSPKRGIFKGVKWPKVDNKKMRYLSPDEAESLLTALLPRSRAMHDMALVSLCTGLRFGEIAHLTWSCVDMQGGRLTIYEAKTLSSNRVVYFPERVKAMLQQRGPGQHNELVFPKRNGKPGAREYVSKTFYDAVEQTGLNAGIKDRKQRIGFHSLRHSYATMLYQNSGDIYLTQKALGHSTPVMTQRYAKMTDDRLKEAALLVEKALTTTTHKEAMNHE